MHLLDSGIKYHIYNSMLFVTSTISEHAWMLIFVTLSIIHFKPSTSAYQTHQLKAESRVGALYFSPSNQHLILQDNFVNIKPIDFKFYDNIVLGVWYKKSYLQITRDNTNEDAPNRQWDEHKTSHISMWHNKSQNFAASVAWGPELVTRGFKILNVTK